MSRFNKDHLRIYLESADSPMFSTINQYMGSATNSPISDLAHNLSGACLGSTPRRRLSMVSNESNTPTPLRNKHNLSLELNDSSASSDLPLSENRILKQSPKSCTAGKAASGPPATRPRVVPWRLGPCHGNYDKENISLSSDTTPVSHSSHDGASSILSMVHSPPSKRLGLLLASPHRARHPLEDHDPNSQDSGYGNSMPEGEECRALESSPSHKTKLAASSHVRVSKKIEENETAFISENHEVSQQVSSYLCASTTEISVVTSPTRAHLRTLPSGSVTPGKKASPHRSPRNLWSGSHLRSPVLLKSHSSGAESIDDGFLEFFELEKATVESMETAELPSGIGSLLSGPIVRNSGDVKEKKQTEQVQSRTTFRRCVSLVEGVQTPPSSRARLCLFREEKQLKSVEKENLEEASEGAFGFKRPEPPEGQIGPARCKRRRFAAYSNCTEYASPQTWGAEVESCSQEISSVPPILHRSISDSEAVIKRALQRSSTDPDLIGDFTRPYSLPLIPGRHQDLKTISSDTLAALLRGEFESFVDSYHIIDCRYPYEYEGGHIRGAKNLFTKDQILKELISTRGSDSSKGESNSNDENSQEDSSGNKEKGESKALTRDILVFHCEFSSERGPSLSRFLRNSDRAWNKECYPSLHYPEIYLLHGGYKAFFDKHRDLCEPRSYLPMADPRFESDFRSCRAKSKSWTGGLGTTVIEGPRIALRGSLKRLGL